MKKAILLPKELQERIFEALASQRFKWQARNRYEQWKEHWWPAWLKRWQPVKYGWVKQR